MEPGDDSSSTGVNNKNREIAKSEGNVVDDSSKTNEDQQMEQLLQNSLKEKQRERRESTRTSFKSKHPKEKSRTDPKDPIRRSKRAKKKPDRFFLCAGLFIETLN